jgi:hypothetical protein
MVGALMLLVRWRTKLRLVLRRQAEADGHKDDSIAQGAASIIICTSTVVFRKPHEPARSDLCGLGRDVAGECEGTRPQAEQPSLRSIPVLRVVS